MRSVMDYNDINGKPVDINEKVTEHIKKIKKLNRKEALNKRDKALVNIKDNNCANNKGF